MLLERVRIQNFRSIIDSGSFAVHEGLTYLLGRNEVGKSALLQALQLVRPPIETEGFSAEEDFPRGRLAEGEVIDPAGVRVVDAIFAPEPEEVERLPPKLAGARLCVTRFLDNRIEERLLAADGTELAPSPEVDRAIAFLDARLPVFVLFDQSILLKSWTDLQPIPDRLAPSALEEWREPYGNQCLMKLLMLTSSARLEAEPDHGDAELALDPVDPHRLRLARAERRLTVALRRLWGSPAATPGSERVRIEEDGTYLKLSVEDRLGVPVEVEQRSDGLRWLLSFLVVLFAETGLRRRQAVLLLDDPALMLDPDRQRAFRAWMQGLAEEYQTIVATHVEALIGAPGEGLRLEVVVDDPKTGTEVCGSPAGTAARPEGSARH